MSQDGKTFSDVVIGSAPDYTFLYVESEVARPVPAIPEIKRGLSISRGIPGTIDGYRVPINTTLEITLQQDLLNQAFMCSNGNLHLSMFDHGRSSNGLFKGEVVDVENMHAHFPGMIVAGRDGFCDVSGRTFTWYDGEAPANLGEVCFDENNSEVYVLNKVTTGIKVAVLPPDGTMPDWWPCANVPPRIHYWAFPNANEFECFEYMNDVLIFDAFGQLTESYFQETGISNIAFDDWKLLCEAVAPYAPEILDAQKIFNNELLFEFEGNELIYKYE